MKTIKLLPLLALVPATCFSQSLTIKPGLWEHTVAMKSESGRIETMMETMKAQIAAMPAAQRQMMENMMAAQGMKFDFANQSFQNCVTPEDAAKGEMEFEKDGNCQKSNVRTEGSTTRIDFACKQVQGEMAFTGDSAYNGTSNMTMKIEGNEEKITATHSGHWVGESCAAVQ